MRDRTAGTARTRSEGRRARLTCGDGATGAMSMSNCSMGDSLPKGCSSRRRTGPSPGGSTTSMDVRPSGARKAPLREQLSHPPPSQRAQTSRAGTRKRTAPPDARTFASIPTASLALVPIEASSASGSTSLASAAGSWASSSDSSPGRVSSEGASSEDPSSEGAPSGDPTSGSNGGEAIRSSRRTPVCEPRSAARGGTG